MDYVRTFNDDPCEGHLSTPISDSPVTHLFINNLAINRRGLSPLLRGLEIGLAHGYFLVGPEILLGPLRDYPGAANLGGLVTAMAIVLLGTACMSAYGSVTFGNKPETPGANPLSTARGWGDLTAGFFLGGMGGAFAAYFLLENFAGIDAIFRGLVN